MAEGDHSADMHTCFEEYCTKKGEMTTKDMKKLFTDAGVLSKKAGDAFESNNLDITFSACKTKGKNCINYAEFDNVLHKLCKKKAGDPKCKKTEEELYKSQSEKLAGTSKSKILAEQTKKKTATNASVDRLTDASKYTGAHKERFGDDGKGKGIEGRKDIVSDTGYVGNYQGEGTFDKK